MNNSFKLAIESFKRDSRFKVGLTPEQAQSLYTSLQPIGEVLEGYQEELKNIRRNGMLSDSGKAVEAEQARTAAMEQIVGFALKIDRNAVIADMQARVATRVNGARERAQKAFPPDAALLAQELRTSVIPRLLAEAKEQRIPAGQALGKMAVRAAEGFLANPVKSEIVLQACATGWPWIFVDLSPETMAQIDATLAQAVAGDDQQSLQQAQGIQRLIDKVVAAAGQELKEMG